MRVLSSTETAVLGFLHRCAPRYASARLIARELAVPTPKVSGALRSLRKRSLAKSGGCHGMDWSEGAPTLTPGRSRGTYVKRPALTPLQSRISRFIHWSDRHLFLDELGGLAMYVGQPQAEIEAALAAMVEGRHLRHSRTREGRWEIW